MRKRPQRGTLSWYGTNLFIACDQVINALLGGWADETLSAYAWRMHVAQHPRARYWRPVIDALFFWQRQNPGVQGHCHAAHLAEIERLSSPPEHR